MLSIRTSDASVRLALAAAGIPLFGACYAEPLVEDDFEVPVVAVLEGDQLRLQAGDAELDGDPEPPADRRLAEPDRVLTYEFVDARGDVIRSGVVADPRHVRSEWDLGGDEMGGREELLREGAAGLWLPQQAGEIRLYEEYKTDGDPLAAAAFEPRAEHPDGIGELTSPLLSFSDLRRSPRRLWGSAPEDEAINVLFVPDGFREAELPEFRRAAEQTMLDMFDEKPQFGRFEDRFNAWSIDIASAESGISNPSRGIDRKTAFETYVNEHDALRTPTLAYGATSYLRRRWGMDLVVVLVNADGHRGSAQGRLVRLPNKSNKHHTFAHELGHALFGLADEYSFEASCTFTKRLKNRFRPNIDNTARRDRIKWSHLIDSSTPVPTGDEHEGVIGAFEGAGTCETGWYRPQHTCMMRSSGRTMCDVCRAEMEKTMRDL